MFNCKQTSQMLSERMERKLSVWERMNLWIHLVMCTWCSGFARDVASLHAAAHRHAADAERGEVLPETHLSSDSRDRMKRILASDKS